MAKSRPKITRPMMGVFTLTMLNLAIVCTLRGLPIMAEEGLSLVFYLVFAALIFLIPLSLVSAELATGWPPRGPGGVFIWVNEAFGPKLGFLAIWLQWVQNVIWFPTILSFIGATLAYAYDPQLAQNRYYMVALILTVYWGGTLVNFRGMKASGLVSLVCVISGTILPGVLIIVFGVIWYYSKDTLAISFTFRDLFPDLSNIRNVVFLGGVVLTFAGMEVSAAHSHEVENPKRTFPRAIFLAAIIALFLLILGALSIAVVVPQKDLSLVAGIMETFTLFFQVHGMKWLIPVMAFLIVVGSVGELSAWIIGPAKGLMCTAVHGGLPPFLRKVNRYNVPTNILLVQGVVATIITMVFLLMPTVSSSYWILTAFCVLIYLIMYVIVFASAIRLRYSQPDVKRGYKIPGGKAVMWLVAGIGILGALFTFMVSFLPPAQIESGGIFFYESFLIGGVVMMCAVPLIIERFRRPHWKEL